MSNLQRINREAAEELFGRFIPMFAEFEATGIDYCLVGGLAVVAHCLARNAGAFRATKDADAMVSQKYSNTDFAKDYLRVYAADPKFSKIIYDAVFGEEGFEQLSSAENAFVNISFVGADEDLDGVSTPDFDVCRTLNGRSLASIERERLTVLGQPIWVASVKQLLDMEHDTISIYGAEFETSPRPQDFVDVGILNDLAEKRNRDETVEEGIFSRLGRMLAGR